MSANVDCYRRNAKAANAAYALLVSDFYNGERPSRVPGMGTIVRLAIRIEDGASVEQAAAREYLYRWNLAAQMDAPGLASCGDSWRGCRVFGAPHLLGM